MQACTHHSCWSSTRDGCVQSRFCNPRPLRRSHALSVHRVLWRVMFSQHRVTPPVVRVPRRTRTVQLLSGLILARCLTSPQLPLGSYPPRLPEFRGKGRQLALWFRPHVLHGLDVTNFKRVRCRFHSDDALSVTIWLALRRLSAFCSHHRVCDKTNRSLFRNRLSSLRCNTAGRLNSTWHATFAHHPDGRAASGHRADHCSVFPALFDSLTTVFMLTCCTRSLGACLRLLDPQTAVVVFNCSTLSSEVARSNLRVVPVQEGLFERMVEQSVDNHVHRSMKDIFPEMCFEAQFPTSRPNLQRAVEQIGASCLFRKLLGTL